MFDGGAGSRWPATREIESYWYPVWLAYTAGMLEGARLLDAPPHHISGEQTIQIAKDFEFLVLFTSTRLRLGQVCPMLYTQRRKRLDQPSPRCLIHRIAAFEHSQFFRPCECILKFDRNRLTQAEVGERCFNGISEGSAIGVVLRCHSFL